MSVEALATAAVQLSKVSKQEGDLRATLTKWVSKTLKPLLAPPKLAEVVRSTSAATVEALLQTVTMSDLRKLAKGLDPHNSGLGAKACAALSAHIVGLVTGEISPAPEPPPKPARQSRRQPAERATPPDLSRIRVASSRSERQAVLQSLNKTELKSYIKTEQLRPAGIQSRWGKDDLVRHILDELDATEAPGPRLLTDSKYGTLVPSR